MGNPSMLRQEPVAWPASSRRRTTGRPYRSRIFEATIPSTPWCHPGSDSTMACGSSQVEVDPGHHVGEDPLLLPLPPHVVLVELPGQPGRLLPVGRHEDPRAAGGIPDPARRVQAGAHAVPEVGLRRQRGRDARDGEKRLDARAGRTSGSPGSPRAPAAGSRRSATPCRPPSPAPPGRGTAASTARAAARRIPSRAVSSGSRTAGGTRPPRPPAPFPGSRNPFDRGRRRRTRREAISPGRWWSVTMTSTPRAGSLPDRRAVGDPAIDRDHQAEPFPRGLREDPRLQAVPVLQPVVLVDPHRLVGEHLLEEEEDARGAGCAVGVVIGVDEDGLAAEARADEPFRRLVDVRSGGKDPAGPTASPAGTSPRRRGSVMPRFASAFAAGRVSPWRKEISRTRAGSGERRVHSRSTGPLNPVPPSPLHFAHLLAAPEDEHRPRHEDGRIASDHDADDGARGRSCAARPRRRTAGPAPRGTP